MMPLSIKHIIVMDKHIIGRLLTLAIVLVSSYACSSRYICYKGIGIVDLENSFLGLAARVCAIGFCHNQF